MRRHVYIVECNDGTLYTGMSKDYVKRIELHNRGKGAKYTRGRGPVKLVYLIECSSYQDAVRTERTIKKLPREHKLDLCADWKRMEPTWRSS